MNPWILISLVAAAIVYLFDLLLRRKRWKNNTKLEKVSLIAQMLSAGPHIFVSALAVVWGITGCGSETAFGKILYDVTLTVGAFYFVVALAATIASFILRKVGKTKASIWVNIIAFIYIIVILGINSLAGGVL